MKLEAAGLNIKVAGAERPADPPKVIMWIAPSGKPVTCRDITEASTGASRFAGEHPGLVVGVYELIGTAYVAPIYPDIEPAERESIALTLSTAEGDAL